MGPTGWSILCPTRSRVAFALAMQEGDLIAENYLLEQRAAAGGMGAVFRGRDVRSGRSVAIKTWLPSTLDEEGLSSGSSRPERTLLRFEREASVLSLLDDSAIVRYVAHGVTRHGEPFLVMHWVEGEDLASRLRERGLTLRETLQLAVRLLPALATLHARGIVHRDVKPANVMLERGLAERAVLVDFGVARRAQLASVTISGARVGTPCYMAPEQIRNAREVDGRADVFALGCVLFECLSGVRAYRADDALGTIAQILLDDPPDLRALRAELPAQVVQLVSRMMSRDRSARPVADASLERELRALLSTADLAAPRALAAREPRSASDATQSARIHVTEFSAESAEQSGYRAPLPAKREQTSGPLRPLLGRSVELSHIAALLESGARTLVLWGPPGIGKTRLSREPLGSDELEQEERCFIELSSASNLDAALTSVLQQIGARISGTEPASAAIARAFAQRGRLLVVLDGVDSLSLELGPLLADWQSKARGLRFLVTSRERSRWAGAVNLELGPLSLQPDTSALAAASGPSCSARLFVECLRERELHLSLDERAHKLIEQIAQRLEGIPLALELGAAQVGLLGLEGLLARLTRGSDAQAAQPSVQLERTLAEAIRASFELLPLDESAVLEACSVFAGPFTLAAAEAVVDGQALTRPLFDILQALREKSLLCSGPAVAGSAALRLSFFAVIRDYARALLSQSGAETAVRQRHAGYYATLIPALLRLRETCSSSELQKQVEIEAGDLLSVIDDALSAQVPNRTLALEALLALEPVIAARGALPIFLSRLERALSPATRDDSPSPTLYAQVLLIRGRLFSTTGKVERASADLERSRDLAIQSNDARLEGFAWLELGVSHHLQQQLADARACYERALDLLRKRGELRGQGRCYGNLGAILHDQVALTEAAAHYWKAIHLLEEAGEGRELANFLANLALLEQELGALEPARRHYERALSLLTEAQDARVRAIALGNLGTLEAECDDWLLARQRHEQALELLQPLDDRRSEALCRARLAAAHAALDSYKLADSEFGQAQRLQSPTDSLQFETIRLQRAFLDLCLARLALRNDDPAEAQVRLEQAEARCAHVEQPELSGHAQLTHSDDIRLTLRLLKPMLSAFRERLEQTPRA